MKIERLEKLKNNKYKIVGDETLTLFDETILKYELLLKKEIENNMLKEILEYDKAIEAYYGVIKKIKYRLKCEKEIIALLKKDNIRDEYIFKILTKLKTIGLLNNDLYISSYINDSVNIKHLGPRKIETDLLALGFYENDIKKHLDVIDKQVFIEQINKLIKKKLKSIHNYSGTILKVKIASFIVHQGFTKEMTMREIAKYDFFNESDLVKEYQKEKRILSRKYNGEDLKNKITQKLYQKGYPVEKINEINQ